MRVLKVHFKKKQAFKSELITLSNRAEQGVAPDTKCDCIQYKLEFVPKKLHKGSRSFRCNFKKILEVTKLKMFDTSLYNDFLEVYNEEGMLVLSIKLYRR